MRVSGDAATPNDPGHGTLLTSTLIVHSLWSRSSSDALFPRRNDYVCLLFCFIRTYADLTTDNYGVPLAANITIKNHFTNLFEFRVCLASSAVPNPNPYL